MTVTKTDLRGAALIDYTGTTPGFTHMAGYGDQLVSLVRSLNHPSAIVIIDESVGTPLEQPVLVRDHLNLTGTSPLMGPNHPSGERFPVVQGIYVDDVIPELNPVVIAGLKPGIKPTADEINLLQSFGASVCCYNMVPSMLICAHAKIKVMGIVVPAGQALPKALLDRILKLTGESK